MVAARSCCWHAESHTRVRGESLLHPFKHRLNNLCHSVCSAKLVGSRDNKTFHHTDRAAIKPSGVCTAKLAKTNMFVHFIIRSNAQTIKHPGLEQQDGRGLEVIVLTDHPEEATEAHAGFGELDLIVGVHAPGEVRKTLMCLRTLLSRRWQPHHVACP